MSLENNPALLGVGYIIGPRIAGIMFAGGALSYLVLIPMIKYFGAALLEPLAPATSKLISEMAIQGKDSIQSTYVLYIGAGAVAAGGMISLARSFADNLARLKGGLADFRGGSEVKDEDALPRTDQDLSLKWVVIGNFGADHRHYICAVAQNEFDGRDFDHHFRLFIRHGFFAFDGRNRLIVKPDFGNDGRHSAFNLSGFSRSRLDAARPVFRHRALSVGGIVCIAASNGGTTSQDLKTGFWVGGTPWKQQIAILVGATVSALVLGPILIQLNNSSTVYQRVEPTAFSQEFRVPEQQLLREGGQLKSETVNEPGIERYDILTASGTTRTRKPAPKGRYLD